MGINLKVPQNSVKVDGRNSSIYLAQNAIKGDDGGYYIPSIDSEGNLTWAPSETEMPAVGGANIRGPKGDSGVWVGTETPDGDYNVWVKPDDVAIEIATKDDLDSKQDKLTAGTNITIENNVISAAGGGSDEVWVGSEEPTGDQTVWIDPTGSETAGLVTQAELANKQDKLTAGTNITIDSNNVISATGSSGGGSSYTFTDGLTETDGTVKWDLNDKIKPYNNSVGIGKFKESSNPSFQNKGYYNLVIGKSEGNYSTYPMFQCDGSDGSILFGHVKAYNNDTSASIRVHTGDNGGSLAGGYVNCYNSSGGIELFGEGSIVIGRVQDGKLGCYGDGTIVIGSNENGNMIAGDKVISANNCQAFGTGIQVFGYSSMAQGKYNILDRKSPNTYAHIVGNGTSDTSRSNAYTLDWQGNGTFAGTVSSSTGADYAEYFEWKDGNPNNEDRVGYIVTLDGDKIVKANSGDDVLGICSGTAMVLGDSAEWNWSKRYLTDDFGRIIYEDYDIEHEEVKDDDGNIIREAWTEHIHAPKQNPNYDISQPYIRRSDRPEWQIVGMMGKLYVRDDGTCEINGYADVINGIATKAAVKTNMRVMERINDSIVRVLLK